MAEERRCTNCGRVIPLDARVCPYCAKKFDEFMMMDVKKHTGYGTASLVIGIVAMCLVWLAPTIVFYFILLLPMGILSLILGYIAYKRYDYKYGLVGAILSLLVLVFGAIVVVMYIYVSSTVIY